MTGSCSGAEDFKRTEHYVGHAKRAEGIRDSVALGAVMPAILQQPLKEAISSKESGGRCVEKAWVHGNVGYVAAHSIACCSYKCRNSGSLAPRSLNPNNN